MSVFLNSCIQLLHPGPCATLTIVEHLRACARSIRPLHFTLRFFVRKLWVDFMSSPTETKIGGVTIVARKALDVLVT
jgi:hypothetical protein